MRNDTTLEVGTECDNCNSHAAKLEQAFIHHNRILVPIMGLQVPGKHGKVRKKLGSYRIGEKKGEVIQSVKPEWVRKTPNGIHIQSPSPPKYDQLKFRRCLGHIALNYVAWKFGWDVALENRFDPLRKFVRYGMRNKMWPYGQISFDDMKPRKKLRGVSQLTRNSYGEGQHEKESIKSYKAAKADGAFCGRKYS